MLEIKSTIAKNIAALRQYNNLTQIELAEKLNYSDKAVSKWERGESIPDVAVLKKIADLFSVSVDYLLCEHDPDKKPPHQSKKKNRIFIAGISVLTVALVATICFVIINLIFGGALKYWLTYIYAVPVSIVVWLVFNSLWFDKRKNFLIISLLLWSVLATVYITGLPFGLNIWIIFIIGIPAQAIIILWSRIKIKK